MDLPAPRPVLWPLSSPPHPTWPSVCANSSVVLFCCLRKAPWWTIDCSNGWVQPQQISLPPPTPTPLSDVLFYPTLSPLLYHALCFPELFLSLFLSFHLSISFALCLFAWWPTWSLGGFEPLNEREGTIVVTIKTKEIHRKRLPNPPSLDSFLLHLSCHEDAFWEDWWTAG